MIMFKEKFRCYEAKIEESDKAGSCQESNPGHLACAASALPLSHNNRTTTSPHNPLYVLIMFASTMVFHQGNTLIPVLGILVIVWIHCITGDHVMLQTVIRELKCGPQQKLSPVEEIFMTMSPKGRVIWRRFSRSRSLNCLPYFYCMSEFLVFHCGQQHMPGFEVSYNKSNHWCHWS